VSPFGPPTSHPRRHAAVFALGAIVLAGMAIEVGQAPTPTQRPAGSPTGRITTQSATLEPLYMPYGYRVRIERVPGIESVGPWNWIGGYYQDERHHFAQFAVDMEAVIAQFPELGIREGKVEDLLSDREGVLIGMDLASEFGWKLGERVTISQTIYAREKGDAWAFNVRAIYQSTNPAIDANTMFLHWSYFWPKVQALRDAGLQATGQDVGIWVSKVRPGFSGAAVAAAVDGALAGGPTRTTSSEEMAAPARPVGGRDPR